MPDVKELAELIGKQADVAFDGLQVMCEILNVRENFGRVDLLVTPKEGSGKAWVSAERAGYRF